MKVVRVSKRMKKKNGAGERESEQVEWLVCFQKEKKFQESSWICVWIVVLLYKILVEVKS